MKKLLFLGLLLIAIPCQGEPLSATQILKVKEQNLIEFCQKGDEFKVQKLIQEDNISANTTDSSGKSALFYALRNKHFNIAKLLLISGANFDEKLSSGNTLLNIFTAQQNLQAVEILLLAGANPNTMNDQGITPLILALDKQSLPLTRMLLDQQADLNFFSHPKGKDNLALTPLMFFTAKKDPANVDFLITLGVDINLKNKQHMSALSIAQGNNDQEIIQILKKHNLHN